MLTFVILSTISIPLAYKFGMPLLSRDGVQFKLEGIWRLLLFGFVVSLLAWGITWWGIMFLYEGVAAPLYEILKTTTKVPAGTKGLSTEVTLVLVLHCVFFGITLVLSHGKWIKAKSGGAIWLAAWAPTLTVSGISALISCAPGSIRVP